MIFVFPLIVIAAVHSYVLPLICLVLVISSVEIGNFDTPKKSSAF